MRNGSGRNPYARMFVMGSWNQYLVGKPMNWPSESRLIGPDVGEIVRIALMVWGAVIAIHWLV